MAGGLFVLPKMHKITQNSLLKKHGIFCLTFSGHENSKVTMDIYAKVKYNKPAQLHGVINRAIDTSKKD